MLCAPVPITCSEVNIVDSNPREICGMLWTLSHTLEMRAIDKKLDQEPHEETAAPPPCSTTPPEAAVAASPPTTTPAGSDEPSAPLLLAWVNLVCSGMPGAPRASNFGTAWKDGLLLAGILHHFCPDLQPFTPAELRTSDPEGQRNNLQMVLDIAVRTALLHVYLWLNTWCVAYRSNIWAWPRYWMPP